MKYVWLYTGMLNLGYALTDVCKYKHQEVDMDKYDYSNLLNVIGNLDVEKKKLINQKELDEKNQLVDLERQLIDSGMLDDWFGLTKALKAAGVRGCPYPETLPGSAQFKDDYAFSYCVNSTSSGYREDWFGIRPLKENSFINYYEHSHGYGSENKIDIFATYGRDPVMHKIRVKTTIIKDFMENYPKYREIKLKELYEVIGKKSEEVEELRNKTAI